MANIVNRQDGKLTVNGNLVMPLFATVANAQAYTPIAGETCFVEATLTTYHYVAAGAAYTVDGAYVLSTGNGGNTRWVGISGQYTYGAAGYGGWTRVPASAYTSAPASTSTLTLSDSSYFVVGNILKYTVGGVVYMGIATAVAANLLTIAGEPMGGAVTELHVSTINRAVPFSLEVSNEYGAAVSADLMDLIMGHPGIKWEHGNARILFFQAWQYSVDTGAEAKVNVYVGANAVSTDDGNNGIQLAAAKTWVPNSAIGISVANNRLARGDKITVGCTVVGGTKDAKHLVISGIIALEQP